MEEISCIWLVITFCFFISCF